METRPKAEVVPVVLKDHENADTLSVVDVLGHTCCVSTATFEGVTKAISIPPDTLIPIDSCKSVGIPLKRLKQHRFYVFSDGLIVQRDRGDHLRIKERSFQGVISWGLLLPLPHNEMDFEIGDDVSALLGVKRYDPSLKYDPLKTNAPTKAPHRTIFEVCCRGEYGDVHSVQLFVDRTAAENYMREWKRFTEGIQKAIELQDTLEKAFESVDPCPTNDEGLTYAELEPRMKGWEERKNTYVRPLLPCSDDIWEVLVSDNWQREGLKWASPEDFYIVEQQLVGD